RRTGAAMTVRNTSVPAVIVVAAKWTARVAIKAPSAPSPSIGRSRPSLSDPEGEIAFPGVGIDPQKMPNYAIGTAAGGTERDRHLAAVDASLASVDALTGGVGHGDAAERRLQLLGEPQRHRARRACDLVADAWLGAVQLRMGDRIAGHKQQQKRGDR